jgi:hypothetical protein
MNTQIPEDEHRGTHISQRSNTRGGRVNTSASRDEHKENTIPILHQSLIF